MARQYTFFFIFICLSVLHGGCGTMKTQPSFRIKEAWYQSWIVNEHEKGTNIYLELKNVPSGMEFDSIIFRNTQLPVFLERGADTVRIKSILNIGIPLLPIDKKVVNKPDQLLYRYNGKRYSYPLKLERKGTLKYNKP